MCLCVNLSQPFESPTHPILEDSGSPNFPAQSWTTLGSANHNLGCPLKLCKWQNQCFLFQFRKDCQIRPIPSWYMTPRQLFKFVLPKKCQALFYGILYHMILVYTGFTHVYPIITYYSPMIDSASYLYSYQLSRNWGRSSSIPSPREIAQLFSDFSAQFRTLIGVNCERRQPAERWSTTGGPYALPGTGKQW